MVAQLEERFPDCKVIDRRMKPTFGYRAVHIVVRTLECRVEIQVRTRAQNEWAQLVESFADSWGRQIRYGGDPTFPTAPGLRMSLFVRSGPRSWRALKRSTNWSDAPPIRSRCGGDWSE